jgi:hypothetical protein
VQSYTPPAVAEPAKADAMESLPAVAVRLDGALTVAGNLPSFAAALKAFVGKIPTRPATDNEFATVDAACKALKKAEEALDQAEAGALASITDVEAMRRAVADCRKLARDTRLAAEKMVERRKQELNEQAVAAARRALDEHVAALNAELAPMALRPIAVDFPGAIKGLRSIASKQDALDGALATGKIMADSQARVMRGNLEVFRRRAAGLEFLFSDLGVIVHKPRDDFDILLDARVAKHQADESRREQERQAAEAAAALAAAAPPPPAPLLAQDECRPLSVALASQPDAPMHVREAAAAILAAPLAPVNEPATLKLGTICDRLGFIVRADFLADSLHIRPASKADGRPGLYTESQFGVICHQLRSHIGAMAELYAGETA